MKRRKPKSINHLQLKQTLIVFVHQPLRFYRFYILYSRYVIIKERTNINCLLKKKNLNCSGNIKKIPHFLAIFSSKLQIPVSSSATSNMVRYRGFIRTIRMFRVIYSKLSMNSHDMIIHQFTLIYSKKCHLE